MKLTKYEKEPIINFNEDEQFASIYTHDSSLKRRLAKFSEQYPDICRPGKENSEGSISYVHREAPTSGAIRLSRKLYEQRSICGKNRNFSPIVLNAKHMEE